MEDKILFCDYFEEWIQLYKVGSVREATLQKYMSAADNLRKIAPDLALDDVNRKEYQKIINKYAETHEKATTRDFFRQLKSCLLDAFDEDLIKKDPTRRIMISGKIPRKKKDKFISKGDVKKLIDSLDINGTINYDYMLLLIIKTGIRFAEAAGLTPEDFDFSQNTITINKTWNYKSGGKFDYTKNDSSIRKIVMDDTLAKQFKVVCKKLEKDKPIFMFGGKNIYNSTLNDRLERYCKKLNIPVISVHSLRHTHASLLLGENVSIASISKRLGHSNMATTQKVYLHIIQELENKDNDIITKSLKKL